MSGSSFSLLPASPRPDPAPAEGSLAELTAPSGNHRASWLSQTLWTAVLLGASIVGMQGTKDGAGTFPGGGSGPALPGAYPGLVGDGPEVRDPVLVRNSDHFRVLVQQSKDEVRSKIGWPLQGMVTTLLDDLLVVRPDGRTLSDEFFESFDVNRDGTLSKAELAPLLTLARDTGLGRISQRQFVAALEEEYAFSDAQKGYLKTHAATMVRILRVGRALGYDPLQALPPAPPAAP